MTGKKIKNKRVKHTPQRTCVACREVMPKRKLIRIVRTDGGVRVDLSGKMPGRGAYLHNTRTCWEKGLKGSLEHALKTRLSDQEKEELRDFMESLPDDDDEKAEMALE